MDNMTALVSCFARACHYRNSNLPVFRIIIRLQSGSMKETAISKFGKFQKCIVPESQNT